MSSESIIEAIGHPIVVTDGLHRIQAWNRRFRDVFELDVGVWFQALPADTVPDNRLEAATLTRISAGEESRELEFNYRAGGDEERHFLLPISEIGWPADTDCILLMFD